MSISRIKNPWLRRGVLFAVLPPLGTAWLIAVMLDAVLNELPMVWSAVVAAWRGK